MHSALKRSIVNKAWYSLIKKEGKERRKLNRGMNIKETYIQAYMYVWPNPYIQKTCTCISAKTALWVLNGLLISELHCLWCEWKLIHVCTEHLFLVLKTAAIMAYWILEVTLERGPGIEVFSTGLSYSWEGPELNWVASTCTLQCTKTTIHNKLINLSISNTEITNFDL